VKQTFPGTAPAINDLLAGQVQMLADNFISSRPYIEAGKLKALAVTSPVRSPYLPEVPTTIESGFGLLQADYLQGLYAPAGTAVEIVQKLNASVNRALESTEIRDNLEKFGAVAEPRSVPDFDSVMVARAEVSGGRGSRRHQARISWSTLIQEDDAMKLPRRTFLYLATGTATLHSHLLLPYLHRAQLQQAPSG
jgi:hypothetical protein